MLNAANGSSWYSCGVHLPPNIAGNGTAMRVAPLAIFHAVKYLKSQTNRDYAVAGLKEDVYLFNYNT
jgi:ADP-ribosylglycohydrolase